MAKIPTETLAAIWREHSAAGYGESKAVLDRWAGALGVSASGLYRILRQAYGKQRQYRRAPNEQNAALAKIVAAAKEQIRQASGGRCPSTERVLEMLIEQGTLCPASQHGEKTLPSVGTINAHIRKITGGTGDTPCVRMEAARPNEIWHTDASVSTVLVAGPEPGTVVVRSDHAGYKRPRNERVWITGVIDAYSRLVSLKYHLIPGESSAAFILHLRELFSSIKDPRYPFGGVPSGIVTDNGAFASSALGKAFCAGANVRLQTIVPGNKRANGKIERTWRELWKSEAELSLSAGTVMTIEEINEWALNWCISRAHMPHPALPLKTRFEMWSKITDLRTANGDWAAVPLERKVGKDLCVTIQNEKFVMPAQLVGKTIVILMGTEGPIGWEDPDSGIIQELVPYKVVPYGEYRGIAKGGAGEIEKLAQTGILTPAGVAANANHGELASPMSSNHITMDYTSPDSAYLELSERVARECGAPLPAVLREKYIALIKCNLTKDYVNKLASDIIKKIKGE